MTNLGGPDFVVVVFGLFAILASPVLAGVSALVIRWERWRPRRALLLVNGGAVLAAFVVVLAWATIGSGPVGIGAILELLGLVLGTTVLVLVVLEVLPLWAGFALAERRGIEAREAVPPVVGGWAVGGLAAVALVGLFTQSMLALVAAVPGAWVGAVGLGPALSTWRGT